MTFNASLDKVLTASVKLQTMAELGAGVLQHQHQVSHDFVEFATKAITRPPFDLEYGHTLHTAAQWAAYGFNTFNLTHSLAAGLLLTEPVPYKGEPLALPFPTFAIVPPPQLIPVFTHGKQVWADLIWIHSFRSIQKGTDSQYADFFRWSVMAGGLSLWRDRHPTNLLDPQDDTLYNHPEDGDPPPVEEDNITLNSALHLVRNLLVYLDSTGGISTRKPEYKPPKRATTDGRLSQGPTMWVLGREVKMVRELRDVAGQVALGRSPHAKPGWKAAYKFVVRGHWKNQVYGPGRSQHKRIWVHPYWKRAESNIAFSHLYKG